MDATISPESRHAVLEERLVDFAATACRIVRKPGRDVVSKHLIHELIRSATSAAADYGEARAAESRRDLVHKLRVCLKELRESYVWLRLASRLEVGHPAIRTKLLDEANELISIFVTSVRKIEANDQARDSRLKRTDPA